MEEQQVACPPLLLTSTPVHEPASSVPADEGCAHLPQRHQPPYAPPPQTSTLFTHRRTKVKGQEVKHRWSCSGENVL